VRMTVSATLAACYYPSPVGIISFVSDGKLPSRRRLQAIGDQQNVVRSKAFGMNRQITTAIHPSPAELSDFALGSLDEKRAAVIEAHVYGCDRCSKVVSKAPGDDFLRQLQASRLAATDESDPNGSARPLDTVGLPIGSLGLAELSAELRNHPCFEIKRLIAEVAMGRFYLAQARDCGAYVAVKLMRPDIADNKRMVDRFLQESRVAEKLRHPNIARVIGFESIGHSALIAMEFVRGRTLAQIVRQRGPLPVAEACEYVRQAASGLACAASHGVVHRDIKPHNFIFDPRARLIKIVDFGLGRLVDEQRTGSRLTQADEILGTLEYISPEQAANSRDADVRSDIYSLGCTFYFLLAGVPPFIGKNAVELLMKHETERPSPIGTLRGDVPQDIASLLERMMQKDPTLRPQSPQDVLNVLASAPIACVAESLFSGRQPPNAGNKRFTKSAAVRTLAMPAVWLPLLTCLVCLMWLLLR
jgi:serine/threonine protein kinase